jgi:hypothetical protein
MEVQIMTRQDGKEDEVKDKDGMQIETMRK